MARFLQTAGWFFLTAAIGACQASTHSAIPSPVVPGPVQPVVGLPSGTDGYPWWNDTIFYEVFLRSFSDSDGNGIGDFNGLSAKLDYLKDLGVTGLWLMPIHPAASYHGYDVLDYFAVNPDYGTLADFRRLLASAHQHGIRLIVDLVLNHTSNRHPWFEAALGPDSPYHDWYLWSAQDLDSARWHPVMPAGSGYYYGFFGAGMPDLNFTNPAVTEQMEAVARFWLQDVGIDGFRVDAAKYLVEEGQVVQNSDSTHAWYRSFRTFYKQVYPQALTVGEVWDVSPTAASYAQGDQLDLTFDFSLAQSFLNSARAARAEDALTTLTADTARSFRPLQLATFLSNHDQNRVRSQLAGNVDKAKVAAAMLLTAPGVPFIYYGEEIGMLGLKPDERIRSPMEWTSEASAGFTTAVPWEPLNPDFADVNVAQQQADPNSLLSFYRSLIGLRNQHAALRVGEFFPVIADDVAVYAVLRLSRQEAALVVINLGGKAMEGPRLTLAASPLSGIYRAYPLFGEGTFAELTASPGGGFTSYQPVPRLAPFEVLILQLVPSQ